METQFSTSYSRPRGSLLCALNRCFDLASETWASLLEAALASDSSGKLQSRAQSLTAASCCSFKAMHVAQTFIGSAAFGSVSWAALTSACGHTIAHCSQRSAVPISVSNCRLTASLTTSFLPHWQHGRSQVW